MSGFIEGENSNQATLRPERLDDYDASLVAAGPVTRLAS